MPEVQIAHREDKASWLDLATEVEPLFGPMVNDPKFHAALERTIDRRMAFCIRQDDGPPETPILAGLLFKDEPPAYKIGWLAVAERARHQGFGRAILCHVLQLVAPPAEVSVTTFGPDVPGGLPARGLYESFGFLPEEMLELEPMDKSRQILRLKIT